ncbi:SH3 domain-containing protein [Blautia sp. MSJ-19]|uniref:SH3 domain-containing protein n=1 Tax=Blautia sp. MSJ-19 TaxID=2841517 RepID=UPI001C0E94A5|nr:SH3 domain-containing protein [Blautia sp. MSJ-19]MBU5480448.1 SH3 domain-containing protein [Blautia sp. MSJ-19]
MKKRFSTTHRTDFMKKFLAVLMVLALSLPVTAQTSRAAGTSYTVTVASGYLALRNAKAYDDANEIGKLYTGDTVEVQDSSGSTYWYVYSSKLNKYGYTDRRYLTNLSSERTVSVKSGYLALRNAKEYKASNEIGELYTGDKVQIADASDSTYWLVFAPGLYKGGYVDKNYLIKEETVTKTVKVESGYLALRNAMAYDSANEIGQLNTGDTVQVKDSSGKTYWYVYSSRLGKSGYVNKNYLQ